MHNTLSMRNHADFYDTVRYEPLPSRRAQSPGPHEQHTEHGILVRLCRSNYLGKPIPFPILHPIQLTGLQERWTRKPLHRQCLGRVIRLIRKVLRTTSQFSPHSLATARTILHQRVQSRWEHGATLGRNSHRINVVQNSTAKLHLQRRHSTGRLEHRDRLDHLGRRPTNRLIRVQSPCDEQRQSHLNREREPGVELRIAHGSASRIPTARAVELGRDGCHECNGRCMRFFKLPGRYVQHELPGGRVSYG